MPDASNAPLDGVLVVDLTHVLAGPFASLTLSDLGARVVKVERPGLGDDTREFRPFLNGQSAYFVTINRGKESIALDLKAPNDRKIFEALLDRADVLLENYRPGVMDRLGYGWDVLRARWPRLVYGAVSGFGHTGPDSQKPAYDMVVQAMGGVMSITGEADREPVRVGASIGDIAAGMFLAQGVLAALYDRERTGRGRMIDVAMLDSQLAIVEHAVAIVEATGESPKPAGARHPSIAPFETYHAEDGLLVIAAGNDALFAKMAATLGLDALVDDPRFATNNARCANVALLKRLIEAVTLERPVAHWIAALEAAAVPCGPIQTVGEAMAHPQIEARAMVVDVEARPARGPHPSFPTMRAAGNPIKVSGAPDPKRRAPAPALDQDRAAVLAWLGLEDD